MMTRLPLPETPRRGEAMRMACRILLSCGVRLLPADPFALAEEMGFRLRSLASYESEFAQGTVDFLRRSAGEEAFTLSRGQEFWIVYNEAVSSPERIRFSIFHEFGHILLRHFDMGKEADFSLAQHQVLEEEADIFARNFFAPPPIVDLVRGDLAAPRYAALFGLSEAAWRVRRQTLAVDRRFIDQRTADALRIQFREYMFGRRCRECGLVFVDEVRAGRCPRCECRFLSWNPGMETRLQAAAHRHVAGARAGDLKPRVGENKALDLAGYWELLKKED